MHFPLAPSSGYDGDCYDEWNSGLIVPVSVSHVESDCQQSMLLVSRMTQSSLISAISEEFPRPQQPDYDPHILRSMIVTCLSYSYVLYIRT